METQLILGTVVQLPLGDYFVIAMSPEGRRATSRRFRNYARMREAFAAEGYALPLKKDLCWRPGVAGSKEAAINSN